MAYTPLTFRSVAFSEAVLLSEIAKASGAPGEAEPADQARYLASYLKNPESGARTILIEAPYIDRHYLEEFTGYYASALHAPSSQAVRLHFFRKEWGTSATEAILAQLSREGPEQASSGLRDDYLGFIVVRPLPSAPIGRTVLRPYHNPDKPRCFEPANTQHDVHLLGLTLRVPGLPFQQQDQGVGACATTAVWSALARVTRSDGARAVTPLAVTLAATRTLALGRAFPANKGLDRSQILEAIRHVGYAPEVLNSYGDPTLFQLALKCYVRSGIPVILKLANSQWPENHAVTVVGYREDASDSATTEIRYTQEGRSFGLRARGLARLFVHDDRFGPYARMTWVRPTSGADDQAEELPRLSFDPYGNRDAFEKFLDPVKVDEAYIPLYPKLRMSATDLTLLASQLLPMVRHLAGMERRESLLVDLRFVLNGRYLSEAHGLGLSSARTATLVSTLLLPRYIGVIRFSTSSSHFLDVICDTTDIPRTPPAWAPVLAFVPHDEGHLNALQTFASTNGRAVVI
ncbi:hypothetical protein EJ065_7333 [Corallococcus coralloides]|uniref:Uncharacterized protein n=1 Tax=Corallococcus coralloides TaxID=184914 RepID=A0A410S455_CORCK|nr:hypothetical protein [Corallococcus coralloides]QAT88858.1 hypothetical protein EJ065_7333 [Corallococcus coralloides]